MNIRSLGYSTDLLILRLQGAQIRERDGFIAIESPDNPTFHWGNFLLFRDSPRAGDLERWTALFEAELPRCPHRAFGWDDPVGPTGDDEAFLAAGYERRQLVAMTAGASALERPPRANDQVVIRPITTDAEWDAVIALRLADPPPQFGVGFAEFIRRSMASYRAMTERGAGWWFGAFAGDELAGQLGLFVDDRDGGDDGGRAARYQDVETHPRFRRQGICRALVHAAARHAASERGAGRFVIVAEGGADVIRVYQACGFAITEQQAGLSWWPRDDSPPIA